MQGFAVIDLETTGLVPGRDRIVELAVVHLDEDGAITGKWETLINPGRDLGAQHVHLIRAADVRHAPTFADVAGQVLELLRGRLIAAHNASFDRRFLAAEFERIGAPIELRSEATLCTMRLASKVLSSGRSLVDCCAAYDIELRDAHSAAADAEATALLLASLLGEVPKSLWKTAAAAARSIQWPDFPPTEARWVPRHEARKRQPHFLARIVDHLPHQPSTNEELEYLSLLDRVLLDRFISEHEKDLLVETATELGLDRQACRRLHKHFFDSLVAVAWEDGILTQNEKEDLQLVANLLDLSVHDLAEALEAPARPLQPTTAKPSSFRLQRGDRIALTGEMQRKREEWIEILRAHGFEPWPSVTKRVALLAAGDPDSLSGKARKAREYGIPIVSESGLESLLRDFRNRD